MGFHSLSRKAEMVAEDMMVIMKMFYVIRRKNDGLA